MSSSGTCRAAVVVLILLGGALARGQVPTDEAYRRLRERQEARDRPATQPTAGPATRPGAAPAATAGAPRRPGPQTTRPAAPATPPVAPAAAGRRALTPEQVSESPLLAARARFTTKIRPDAEPPSSDRQPPEPAPPRVFTLVRYPAAPGRLAAYLSPDPHDGKRHPAVLWVHGGYGGGGSYLWTDHPPENDQSPRAFREAGFVVLAPNWRGQGDNPGKVEMFYGEVEDALAAIDYLARVPYVDPNRIYLVGHSTGGTVALLAAECATHTTKLRAAFSLGGCPDVRTLVREPDHHHAPFDYANPEEVRLRSAADWVDGLKTPTWYFEGDDSVYVPDALQMDRRARRAKAPFRAFYLKGKPSDHFSIIRPVTALLARKLAADTGPTCNISIEPAEVADAFNRQFNPSPPVRCVVAASPPIELTERAKAQFLRSLPADVDKARAYMALTLDDAGKPTIRYGAAEQGEDLFGYVVESAGMKIRVDDEAAMTLGPTLIDVDARTGALAAKPAGGGAAPPAK